MGLFSKADAEKIQAVAQKSKLDKLSAPKVTTKVSKINDELDRMSREVSEYFKDSNAILITTEDDLHQYIDKCIEAGIAGIDTETTGLDRTNDTIVGCSLYYPGGAEAYIPNRHKIYVFEDYAKNQLSYEVMQKEIQRLVDNKVKLIFANADFDLAMIYKDYKVDLIPVCYYDVILAWRCIKEDERDNSLKGLYAKYVLGGKGDPKKFSDFFSPELFPYCKPEIAKLYAANDAKITYELYQWQLPYITPTYPKCQKKQLESIASLIWNIEFPMIKVCQELHRTGIYLDSDISNILMQRYSEMKETELAELKTMVQEILDSNVAPPNTKVAITSGSQFNPNSTPQVAYLVYDLLKKPIGKQGRTTDKAVLKDFNLPVTNKILKVRSLDTLISTFVEKMPKSIAKDHRIHGTFKSVGADCVVGNTVIPTANGYKCIKGICEKATDFPNTHIDVRNIQIVNGYGDLENVKSVVYFEDYPTIKITTDLQYSIEGTYNHPIISCRDGMDIDFDFHTLDELKVGDVIKIPLNYTTYGTYQKTNLVLGKDYNKRRQFAKAPEIYTEEFAEFLGMYHADGNTKFGAGTYRICLSNKNPDVITRFRELSESLFNVTPTVYVDKKRINSVASYISCQRLSGFDTLVSHGKQYKKIPEAIWKSPKSVINSYLKGMTLDSSVFFRGKRCRFYLNVANSDDARMIQTHLASQGILCGWKWCKCKDVTMVRLSFNADNYIKFRDNIGFICKNKIVDTLPSQKTPGYSIDDNFAYLKITDVIYSHADVYDVHMEKTHSFISNGIISHNTGRMSSADPNLQNLPSHANDIRHMFRATPGYVMLSSDYS